MRRTLESFNEVVDETPWEEHLNEWNHSPLHSYVMSTIGETYPLDRRVLLLLLLSTALPWQGVWAAATTIDEEVE